MEPNFIKPTRVYSIVSGPTAVESSPNYKVEASVSKDFGASKITKEYTFPDEEQANLFVERIHNLPDLLKEDMKELLNVLAELKAMEDSGEVYFEMYDADDLPEDADMEEIMDLFKDDKTQTIH